MNELTQLGPYVLRSGPAVSVEDVTARVGQGGRRPPAHGKRWPLLAAAAVLVLLTAGVAVVLSDDDDGSDRDERAAKTIGAAVDYVRTVLGGAAGGAGGGPPAYQRLADLLPNTQAITDDGIEPIVDLVVVGRVTAVEPGTAYKVLDDAPEDAPNDGQVEVPFESAEAFWRTLHVTVDIEQSLTPDAEPDTIVLGLVVYTDIDIEEFQRGMRELGRSVFFLSAGSPVFDYDSSIYAAPSRGKLIASIADDGTLSLPLVDADSAGPLLVGTPDLDSLVAAGSWPPHTIDVRLSPTVVVPEPHPCPDAEPGSATDLASESPTAFVPEPRWTDASGCFVRWDHLQTVTGAEHCGWQATATIHLGDPVGSAHFPGRPTRHYTMDPTGAFADPTLTAGFDPDAELPSRVRPTGFWRAGAELWIVADDPSAVFVVRELEGGQRETVERWPLHEEPPGCD